MTSNLNNIVLRCVISLSQYNDVYDQSLLRDIRNGREMAVKYERELRKLSNNKEIIKNIDAYETLFNKRQALADKIISAVEQHKSVERILSLRQEMEVLDNESISYLNRILEIANADLQQTIIDRNSLLNNLQESLVFLAAIILIIIICASYWIMVTITTPIKAIDSIVRRISQGDFNVKMTIESNDEFGRLAIILNDMVMKLKKSHIQSSNMMKKLQGEVNAHQKAENLLKIKESEIKFMAYHDHLTGISNRAEFERIAKKSLFDTRHKEKKIAILFIDLDRFKVVNDTLGHLVGDILLQATAKRLLSVIRETDTLSRLGGDEFAVIIENIEKKENVEYVAQKLLNAAKEPFFLQNHIIHISASIGIALYPEDGNTVLKLMKNADTALYKAKKSGKNVFVWYS